MAARIRFTPEDCFAVADSFKNHAIKLQAISSDILNSKFSDMSEDIESLGRDPIQIAHLLSEQAKQLDIYAHSLREIGNSATVPDECLLKNQFR